MHIWVDADACPGEIKELLFRAAERTKTKVTLVANQPLRTPFSDLLTAFASKPVQTSPINELSNSSNLATWRSPPIFH